MPLKLLESNLVILLWFICNTRSKLFLAKFLPDISVNALLDTFSHSNLPKVLKKVGCIFSNPLWERSKYSNWFWALKVFWKEKKVVEYNKAKLKPKTLWPATPRITFTRSEWRFYCLLSVRGFSLSLLLLR